MPAFPRPGYFIALAALLGLSLHLCAQWESKLVIYPEGRDLVRAQSSEEEDEEEEEDYAPTVARTEKGVSQKISRAGGLIVARYNFINFNKDNIGITFSLPEADYKKYLAGYGYTDAEMAGLRSWREKARLEAWNAAVKTGGKAAGEKAIAGVELDYETRMRGLFRSRGLALRKGNTVECDMPVIVKRNTKMMQALALAIQKIAAERKYGSEETTGAVLSLVQTALRYKIPPLVEHGVHTGGLLPPARAMLSGWGDCDTKTGLAASILSSWNTAKMVGVAVPGHYLMAIRRLPAKGDVFVRHEGLEYVLVEPAGPAWLEPGQVGKRTTELLRGAEGYQLEPFF
ncbi:MAG TPA: hypothetical protein DCZ92_02905 [Elusimicrobia bacterium]|nr:MAG: hypothetical protein A2016_05870 [Elusimicrobia bacterium GWF2_62_30]HBA59773.1 hypothetical protein [Elusimicrobiota bacterium]